MASWQEAKVSEETGKLSFAVAVEKGRAFQDGLECC